MTYVEVFAIVEAMQLGIATLGAVGSFAEWTAIYRLRHSHHSPAQRTIARHAIFIEILRCSVHCVIILTAGISFWLPQPPEYMPHWISEALVYRKLGLLWISVIATAGTWSSRIMRRKLARQLREQEA